MNTFIVVLIETVCIVYCLTLNDSARKFAIEIKETGSGFIFQELEENHFRILYKVIQEAYIFEYQGTRNTSELNELISRLKIKYKNTIVAIERVIVYDDNLKPGGVSTNPNLAEYQIYSGPGYDNYYGMGVRRAWSLGYTGKGVTIAVTDVGIHTDLLDLKNNITFTVHVQPSNAMKALFGVQEDDFCYNFINNSKNITPEVFHNLQAESAVFTDHGDHCASIIASAYENGICSSGIAFNASVVGLKVFMVSLFKNVEFHIVPKYSSRSDIVARAFAYNHTIDIYSNAWAPTDPFIGLDTLTKDVIKHGAEKGRQGLGMIYVFPAGPPGNGFANSIYTIAVNGVGKFGCIHKDSTLSASVITSGLADGSNITASYMLATSRNNKCVTNFKGVSPATAQVAAVIGLALEANRNLTLRDVQHLLVQASEPVGIPGENNFTLNGAGRYFHSVFGYGLLNAELLVTLAAIRQPLAPLLTGVEKPVDIRYPTLLAQEVEFCYSCAINDSSKCVSKLEHVTVNITFQTACGKLQIVLVSPNGTESVLVHLTDVPKQINYTVQLVSVQFWDEAAFGNYLLKISDGSDKCGKTNIKDVTLTLYGTMEIKVAFEKQIPICDKFFSLTSQSPPPATAQPGNATHEAKGFIAGIILACIVVCLIGFIGFICYIRRKRNHTAATSMSYQSVPRSTQQLVLNDNDDRQQENTLLDGANGDVDANEEEENNEEA